MSIRNSMITTELISDFAGGRLDAEDAQIIQEAINHDEVIATAVADARRVNARMHRIRCGGITFNFRSFRARLAAEARTEMSAHAK